jgi:sulfite reductase (NADPH) flavoprotein alpha-component
MTISIWRYSHFLLAISSALFIFIATITGIVLAFEPISNQLQSFSVKEASEVSIAQTINALQNEYNEVVTIEVDKNDFVVCSVITQEGESETFYVNPLTGKKLGTLIKRVAIFEFATNLHRSLFLKSTGRFLVCLFSLLLLLISLTGIRLILKRQGGVKRFYSKVVKENFEQYYHVVIGRYALIPIVIITITGVFLSLEKFDILPSDRIVQERLNKNSNSEKLKFQDFEIFKTTQLNQLISIEFPFSDNEEDYFVLELKDKELYINQYSGNIISKGDKSLIALASHWSTILHTGQGTIIWSIILLLTCFTILFFMYSGFSMTVKRKNGTAKIKNKFKKDEADYIILVGSETGNTSSYAKLFFDTLIEKKQSVFIDELNNYANYQKAKQLIIFTATYGEGEAPSNATNFGALLEAVKQENTIKYSVVGFGSLMYPDFCTYAIFVDALLQKQPNYIPNFPLCKINNQSFRAFKSWIAQWNQTSQLNLKVEEPKSKVNRKKLKDFKVIKKTALNVDSTFLIQLHPKKKQKFQSGDLLGFYPEQDNVERLYSIGRVRDTILLSIKKHDFGICSNQLNALTPKTMIKAKIKRNLDFHFPKHAKEVVMISNGTGIAPFLGMISENNGKVKTHLFWGGRTEDSLKIYSEVIDTAFKKKTLSSFHLAYSQEQYEKVYVQDLIEEKADLLAEILKNEGVIMICGAIAMQNRVLEILNNITIEKLKQPLSVFENNEQVKMDCY